MSRGNTVTDGRVHDPDVLEANVRPTVQVEGRNSVDGVEGHVHRPHKGGSNLAEGDHKVCAILSGAARLEAAPLDTRLDEGTLVPPTESPPPHGGYAYDKE